MENTQSIPSQQSSTPSAQQHVSQNNSRLFVVVVTSVLVTAALTGSIVFFWQKSANEKVVNSLEQKLTSLEEQISIVKNAEIVKQPISTPALSTMPAADLTTNWEVYKNTRIGYQIKFPQDFEIVKGPVPEAELPTLNNISFSGKQKPQDSNSGVVFGLNANPTDANGVALSCHDNDDCVNAWMRVLGKPLNEVSLVSVNILGAKRKGFKYTNQNPLYNQQNSYFVFPYKDRVWVISLTINNFSDTETREMNLLFDQILSTFKFTN